MIQLHTSIVLFVCMSLAGSRWLGLLCDPVTGVILVQCADRWEIFVWTFCGMAGAVALILALFFASLGAILSLKGVPVSFTGLALGFVLLLGWAMIFFPWECLLAMFTEHPMSVLLLLVMLFFVSGSMLENLHIVGRPLLRMLNSVLPPTRSMKEWTAAVILGRDGPSLLLASMSTTPLLCLIAGFEIFRRRDL